MSTMTRASKRWKLQDARNRLSELVRKAREEGPQVITLRGRDVVVVMSTNEFGKRSRPRGSLVDFFRKSPLAAVKLAAARPPAAAIRRLRPTHPRHLQGKRGSGNGFT